MIKYNDSGSINIQELMTILQKGSGKMKIRNEKLELAMANACMNYKELSEATEMTQESLSKIRTGRQNPRPATVGKIAKALNVKVEDLVE